MKRLYIEIPYPVSVNSMYCNRRRIPSTYALSDNIHLSKSGRKGRGLSVKAKEYKNNLASLIFATFPTVKFKDSEIHVNIIDHGNNPRRDMDNGLKIVFDSIQGSGLIYDDRQITSFSIEKGEPKNPPTWELTIERKE